MATVALEASAVLVSHQRPRALKVATVALVVLAVRHQQAQAALAELVERRERVTPV